MTRAIARVFSIMFALLTCLQPAQATPPRYASIHDTPIGINQTHMFLFRTVDDNEGSYYIRNTHRFLISQKLETGHVDQIWLLDETRETSVEIDERTYQYKRAEPKIDPLEILHKFSAVPLSVTARSDWLDEGPRARHEFILSNEGIVSQYIEGATPSVPSEDILSRIRAGLDPIMKAMRDDKGPIDPITFDTDAYSTDLSECFVIEKAANASGYDVFRLECESGEYAVLSYVIYLTVPEGSD